MVTLQIAVSPIRSGPRHTKCCCHSSVRGWNKCHGPIADIPTRQVRPLEAVAVKTAPRQVFRVSLATMFEGDDVIDLKRGVGQRFRQMAVLAPRRGATANELSERVIHRSRSRLKCLPRLQLQDIDHPRTAAVLIDIVGFLFI